MVLSLIKKNTDKLFLAFIILSTLTPRFGAIDNNAIRWLSLSLICCTYLLNSLKLNSIKLSKKHILFSGFIISYLLFSVFISNNIIEGIIGFYKILILIVVFFICCDIFKKISNPFFGFCIVLSISLFIESSFILIEFFSSLDSLTGIASNPNISSSSIILKLPFIIFLGFQSLKRNQVLLLKIIELTSILGVIILGSRLGVLSLLLIYLLTFLIYKDQRQNQILPLLVVIIFGFYINISDQSDNLKIDTLSIENLSKDESTNQRLIFYKKAINLSFKKPVFGYGLGSWKYESLPYKENYDRNILVSYYTHNDFLQILFELGIIGLVIYLSFLNSLMKKIFQIENRYKGILTITLIVFLINSLLNFPLHRSQEIIPFVIISALIFSLRSKTNIPIRSKAPHCFLISLVTLGLALSYLEHNSLKMQGKLISDYNQNLFSIDKEKLNNINYYIPNLSANAVPISTYLSRYYFEQKDYTKSIELLNLSTKANYKDLMTQELLLKNYIFIGENNLALLQSKKLMKTYPKTSLYSEIYFSLIDELNVGKELNVELLNNNKEINFHLLFFKTLDKFETVDRKTKENLINKSLEIFPNNSELLKLFSMIKE